ncbi:hypothetical protein ABDI30_00825 [Paenibacillus cisolokensis]|uniref:hypothetical protein n=1 Tax=Paenibacillus cisolokensis TaxID=1658519 RepID=UPI003D2C4829
MKSIKKKLQVTTMASALVVSSLVAPVSAFADDSLSPLDSFIPHSINSQSEQRVIEPYMGNERVIISGSVYVSNSYEFGNFTVNNNSIKIDWRPFQNSGNNFRLQLMQENWLGESTAIATLAFGNSANVQYFTNVPTGKKLSLKIVGQARGDIYGYDWGPL